MKTHVKWNSICRMGHSVSVLKSRFRCNFICVLCGYGKRKPFSDCITKYILIVVVNGRRGVTCWNDRYLIARTTQVSQVSSSTQSENITIYVCENKDEDRQQSKSSYKIQNILSYLGLYKNFCQTLLEFSFDFLRNISDLCSIHLPCIIIQSVVFGFETSHFGELFYPHR